MLSRKHSTMAAALVVALMGAVGQGGIRQDASPAPRMGFLKGPGIERFVPATGDRALFRRVTVPVAANQTEIMSVAINGQNPATVGLGDWATLEIGFGPGESIAFVSVYIDLDQDQQISVGDAAIRSAEAFVDNSWMDEDTTAGRFFLHFPVYEPFPLVGHFILEVKGEQGSVICPVQVTAPTSSFSISGTVTEPPGVANIVVIAMLVQDMEGEDERIFATVTDGAGNFHIDIPDEFGNSHAMVMAMDFLGVAPGYVFSQPIETDITGHVAGLTLAMLQANAWVRVEVREEGGQPVPDVRVYVEGDGPGVEGTTDANGVAVVGFLAGMPVEVGVDYERLWPEYMGSRSREVVLAAGDTARLSFNLVRADTLIGGRVLMDGYPFPGIRVHAGTDSLWSFSWTDINGAFQVPVASGVESYWLGIDQEEIPEGYIVRYSGGPWPPGSSDVLIEVIRSQGEIHGRVTDRETGQPVAAWVWASSWEFSAGDSTDAQGYYRILVPNGSYEVGCQAQGYLQAWASVEVQDSSVEVNFELERFIPGCIRGTVYDTAGNPLPGVKVVASSDSAEGWSDETVTADDGTYVLNNVAPGPNVVHAVADLWVLQFYDGAEEYGMATRVRVAPGDTVWGIDFTLEPGGAIRGQVRDAKTGEPVGEAWLAVWNLMMPWLERHVGGEPDGSYVIGGLRPGPYFVVAENPWAGYLGTIYDGHPHWEKGDTVWVRPGEYTDNIDLALVWGAAIRGTVVDSTTWYGIANVPVILYSHGGGFSDTVHTDEYGQFAFYPLETGDYYLVAHPEAQGYSPLWYPGVTSESQAQPLHIEAGFEAWVEFHTFPAAGVSEGQSSGIPKQFCLHPAYPNPFNAQVVIRYEVPKRTEVEVAIYDVLGRRVKTLAQGPQVPGNHMLRWDGRTDAGTFAPSGLYLITMKADGRKWVRKVTLLK